MSNRKTLALIAGLAAAASASPALAGTEVVAGWEGTDSNDYAFVAPVFSMPASDGMDILLKPTVAYLRYQTRDATGTTSVSSPGGSLGLGLRLHGKEVTFELMPALEYIHEKRSLPGGSTTSKDKWGAAIAGNMFVQASKSLTLSALANYSQTSHYFWSRAGAKLRLTNRDYSKSVGLGFGPEFTYQTGNGTNQYGVGAMGEIAFDKSALSLQFRAGYSQADYSDGSNNKSPYFGVGLYHHF